MVAGIIGDCVMSAILSQMLPANPAIPIPSWLFTRLDVLAHPTELIRALEQTGIVVGAIFIAVGLVCMLQGYRLYKWVVIIAAMGVGMGVGYQLGHYIKGEVIIGGCVGVLLAVVAWPLMKYAVALCGGLAGAFIGATMWSAIAGQINSTAGSIVVSTNAYWAGALTGLIFFGLLSFLLFELSIIIFTSVSGSVLAVLGIIALLLQVPIWHDTVTSALEADPMIIPMIVIVPIVIGLVVQYGYGGLNKIAATDGSKKK